MPGGRRIETWGADGKLTERFVPHRKVDPEMAKGSVADGPRIQPGDLEKAGLRQAAAIGAIGKELRPFLGTDLKKFEKAKAEVLDRMMKGVSAIDYAKMGPKESKALALEAVNAYLVEKGYKEAEVFTPVAGEPAEVPGAAMDELADEIQVEDPRGEWSKKGVEVRHQEASGEARGRRDDKFDKRVATTERVAAFMVREKIAGGKSAAEIVQDLNAELEEAQNALNDLLRQKKTGDAAKDRIRDLRMKEATRKQAFIERQLDVAEALAKKEQEAA